MIKRLAQLLLWVPRRLKAATSAAWQPLAAGGVSGLPSRLSFPARRVARASRITWRVVAKVLLTILGMALFLGLEYALALAINAEQWYLLIAMLVGGSCLVAVIAKPSVAFMVWIMVSPIAGIYLRLGKVGDLPQITFDRVVIYTLALVLLARALVQKGKINKLILPELLFLGFPLYVLLTIPFFPHEAPQREMLIFMKRAGDPILIYFIAKSVLSERKYIAGVIAGLLVVGIYSSGMAMYDHFTGKMSLAAISGIDASLYYSDAGGRAAGPFLGPMDLGIMLGIAVPLAINYAEWTKRAWAKFLYFLIVPAMAAACFFTYTRGAYLVLIVVMLLMPLLGSRSRKRYSFILLTLVVLAMIGIPVMMAQKDVAYRLTTDKTALQRVTLAKTLVNMIKANPVFGVGLENYKLEMPHYIADTPRARHDIWNGGTNRSLGELTSSHNAYLTLLSDHGIVGFTIFMSTYLGFMLYIFRGRKRLAANDLLGRDLASMVFAVLIGYLLSMQTTGYGSGYIHYLIWILIALTVRLIQMAKEAPESALPTARPERELAI